MSEWLLENKERVGGVWLQTMLQYHPHSLSTSNCLLLCTQPLPFTRPSTWTWTQAPKVTGTSGASHITMATTLQLRPLSWWSSGLWQLAAFWETWSVGHMPFLTLTLSSHSFPSAFMCYSELECIQTWVLKLSFRMLIRSTAHLWVYSREVSQHILYPYTKVRNIVDLLLLPPPLWFPVCALHPGVLVQSFTTSGHMFLITKCWYQSVLCALQFHL